MFGIPVRGRLFAVIMSVILFIHEKEKKKTLLNEIAWISQKIIMNMQNWM